MNLEKFTESMQAVLQSAQLDAQARQHQQLTPEHLFRALLDEDPSSGTGTNLTTKLLEACHANIGFIEQGLEKEQGERPL